MALTIVSNNNVDKEVFKNMRKHLIANSISTKITPSFTDSTTIPCIVIETSSRQASKHTGKGVESTISTVTIVCIAKTYEASNDLINSIRPFLDSDDLRAVNMSFSDVNVSNTNIPRGDTMLQGRILTAQYTIL